MRTVDLQLKPHAQALCWSRFWWIALLLGFGLTCLSACGPAYPACNDDAQCQSRNQVCVDRVCRDCRDDSQCNGLDPCMTCQANACEREPACCKSDLDCPGGKCWRERGAVTGQCGGQCQSDEHCPDGQRCLSGTCTPEQAGRCKGSEDCAEGQQCIGGRCVDGECRFEPVLFDFDAVTVRMDQTDILERNAACMLQHQGKFILEGHCDDRGSEEYNLALSTRRAQAVRRAYEKLGVKASVMMSVGFGEEKPGCLESNDACWQANRRVETIPR